MITASDLPDVFVCFCPYRGYPHRFVRKKHNDWNVYHWKNGWDFYDNFGDGTALQAFSEADCLYQSHSILNCKAPELLAALRDLMASFESYIADNKPESEWDEYDYMMLPRWKKAAALLKELDG